MSSLPQRSRHSKDMYPASGVMRYLTVAEVLDVHAGLSKHLAAGMACEIWIYLNRPWLHRK
jgi:hypothetical protein